MNRNDMAVGVAWSVEDRFRLLVDTITDYAIYMLDPEGYIATWNAGAERFKGYKADEILGELLRVGPVSMRCSYFTCCIKDRDVAPSFFIKIP